MFTAIRHRGKPEVRMLNWSHICLMCICAILIAASFALVWLPDPTTYQCRLAQWLYAPPLSLLISLNNLKAYRLSKFLANVRLRNLRFSHERVLFLSILWPIGTSAVLLLSQLIDPLYARRINVDVLRPALSYHACSCDGNLSQALLPIGFIIHVAFSIRSIWLVRNGVEGFRDGTMLKEGFIVLYALLALTFGLQLMLQGNVNKNDEDGVASSSTLIAYHSLYTIRATIVQISVFLFLLRVLGSRLATLWLSQHILDALSRLSHLVARVTHSATGSAVTHTHLSNKSAVSHMGAATTKAAKYTTAGNPSTIGNEMLPFDSPVYAAKAIDKQSTDDMWRCLASDPQRLAHFVSFAQSLHSEDGLLFCLSSQALPTALLQTRKQVMRAVLLPAMCCILRAIYRKYCMQGADLEVNLPSTMRSALDKQIQLFESQCAQGLEREKILTSLGLSSVGGAHYSTGNLNLATNAPYSPVAFGHASPRQASQIVGASGAASPVSEARLLLMEETDKLCFPGGKPTLLLTGTSRLQSDASTKQLLTHSAQSDDQPNQPQSDEGMQSPQSVESDIVSPEAKAVRRSVYSTPQANRQLSLTQQSNVIATARDRRSIIDDNTPKLSLTPSANAGSFVALKSAMHKQHQSHRMSLAVAPFNSSSDNELAVDTNLSYASIASGSSVAADAAALAAISTTTLPDNSAIRQATTLQTSTEQANFRAMLETYEGATKECTQMLFQSVARSDNDALSFGVLMLAHSIA